MAEFRTETARLVLRDWREDDWGRFWELTNTPVVMRWLGGVADEAGRAAARARLELIKIEHGHTFWVVERKQDGGHLAGELLGFCGLKKSNQKGGPQGEFEIGWRLREDAWGKGYAREAAEASMALGFERWRAPHVIALTVASNEASWGLMKRLGMQRCEELDFRSAAFDPEDDTIIVYSITCAQWLAQQSCAAGHTPAQ